VNESTERISEEGDFSSEAETLQLVIGAMQPLSKDGRERLIKTVSIFFDLRGGGTAPMRERTYRAQPTSEHTTPSFSEDRSMSPKEFLLEKQPRTDVERVACLAYYLTHYRDTQHFKTIDISKLNTESAQRKFSNAAKAVDNAARSEYLVTATKGQKQLGAVGEVFVEALPDRDRARDAVAKIRPRKRRTNKKATKS
jgi:hypothetical protein